MTDNRDSGEELPQFEPVTLANMGDGRLEVEFCESLTEVQETWIDPKAWSAGADGWITSKIKVDIEIGYDPDTGLKRYAFTTKVAKPAKRKIVGALFAKDGVMLIEPDRQISLLPPPTPINRVTQED